ncbi:DJ-1/PfpI family protein, partial [[Clostridium] scindens]|nr:DJ-1/PfpI family protein [[Clostridium] scindens]
MADEELLSLIRSFDKAGKLIAAISCAPMILVNAGIMKERRYVASVDRECFMAGGACTSVELSAGQMKGLLDMKE